MPVESRDDVPADRIARLLLDWYGASARTLPWRAPPGSTERPDPYRVWLSEVMLQQTTVAAVIPYFERFTTRWPSMAALAAADEADVLAAWAGLGYYSRARNLIACARVVASEHGGALPAEEAALRALPGIGAYTAAAIAAIGFGGHAIPIDANIERVVARLFAITHPLPGAKAAIAGRAARIWPQVRGGDFAQALMDLGATICIARTPRCTLCPLASLCAARAQGIANDLPRKAAKAARPLRHGRAQWITRDHGGEQQLWLVRRPARGMLGGMRALPGGEWGDAPQPAPNGAHHLGHIRHIFTHFALDLAVDHGDSDAIGSATGEWWPLARLEEAGLPTLYCRAAALALAGGQNDQILKEDR